MMRRQSAGGILSRKVSIVLITMSVLPERNRLQTHTKVQKENYIKLPWMFFFVESNWFFLGGGRVDRFILLERGQLQ